MNRYSATLHFDSMQNAMDAGYCDAVPVNDDVPEMGYMSVISFMSDGYEVETADESLDVEVTI